MVVLALGRRGQPLMPCSEKRARRRLEHGRARAYRIVPFVIRLVDRRGVKLDSGGRVTGLTLVREAGTIDAATRNVARTAHVLAALSPERVRVERQVLEHPLISGVDYQQGTLKRHVGAQAGDAVRAQVPSGKKADIHVGRGTVCASGSFNLQTAASVVQWVRHQHYRLIQRADGYGYILQPLDSTIPGERESGLAPQAAPYLPGLKTVVSCTN